MDQLKTLDTLFLGLESPDVQSNIGGVSIQAGPAPSFKELTAYLDGRLDAIPRYRQRIRNLAFGFASPIWVDDPDFEIGNHLKHYRLPKSGSLEQLNDYYAELASEHLDRDKSLWQVVMVEGLADGSWALCWKVHHVMVDGIAAVELLSLLMDFSPEAPAQKRSTWRPAQPPSKAQLWRGALTGQRSPIKPLRDIGRAVTAPKRVAEVAIAAARVIAPAGKGAVSSRRSPLNGPIGPRRRWRTAAIDLADAKQIGKHFGGTVNDVILAVMASGIRDLLLDRGAELSNSDTRSLVPVSVRAQGDESKLANDVSGVFVELPVAEASPSERLKSVHEQMTQLKQSEGQAVGKLLFEIADYVPPALFGIGERIAWRLADTERLMNTVTTNVPGPQAPLYCMGRRVTALYPYVMLAKNIRLTTAIFSYDGRVYFGVTGDYESTPDLDVVTEGIVSATNELLKLTRRKR